MNVFVCCKQVPDVAMSFTIKNGEIVRDDLNYVLNAYDASAVEGALKLREEKCSGMNLSLVLVGDEKGKEALRKGLAMGADQAWHLCDPAFEGSDSLSYAEILFAFFKNRSFDLILTGKQSQDMDLGLTGGMLAQKLGISYVTNAVSLDIDEVAKKVTVHRQGDEGKEVIELSFPCLVTCSNDMNEPRIPSLKGIMASKKKPMESLDAKALGIDAAFVGLASKTKILSYREPAKRKAGIRMDGDALEMVKNLLDKLTNEARVL